MREKETLESAKKATISDSIKQILNKVFKKDTSGIRPQYDDKSTDSESSKMDCHEFSSENSRNDEKPLDLRILHLICALIVAFIGSHRLLQAFNRLYISSCKFLQSLANFAGFCEYRKLFKLLGFLQILRTLIGFLRLFANLASSYRL